MIIGELLSNNWTFIGNLTALRLKKSGIEYVILAGSSLFGSVSATVGLGVSWARAARDFSKDFDILGPQNPKKSLARRGMQLTPGPQLSNNWNNY